MVAPTSSSGTSDQPIASSVASAASETSSLSRWWRLFGGVLMTLALGTLYAWSVFVAPLEREFGWRRSQTSAIFTVAAVAFAAALLFAGRLQDRFGPFAFALAGSLLFTLSFFLFSRTASLLGFYLIYGVLGGIGIGFGYGVVVPVMAKWFPDRTGLAIGLALAGFGSGSAVFGTFANLVLFPRFGWRSSCVILSGIFLAMTMTAAFLLRNPPPRPSPSSKAQPLHVETGARQYSPGEVLRMPTFYLLWLGFGLGSTAGLMVISQLIPFANSQGISSAALATLGLVVGAGGNVSGRVLSGWLSDLLGRLNMLRVVLAMSAAAMPALYWAGAHLTALYLLIFAVYFGYGAQASVIPATVADFWGARHAGSNYGSIFTAWGFSGILGPTIGGVLFDRYRNYGAAFYTAAGLAAVALICVVVARRPSAR
jgi:OFA family oxalate/formate antiporter-like MFS transporter